MKKNGILTLLFACIPGAGQMYQGYMKRGLSLITMFCLFIILGSTTGLDALVVGCIVVYMYSFFDTLNLRAQLAAEKGYDYFTTTLSISPLKNAAKLNEIGQRLAKEYGVEYLISDFKKKNGYKRSTELSKIYGLYRQDYCGCEFSQRQRK